MNTGKSYENFLDIIKKLRSPDGCPWDREQTPLSMREALVEEVYEVLDAINEGKGSHVKEELGDVLLNATMVAYMYEQEGDFSVADVLDCVVEKLIRRHPHVFPESAGQENALQEVKTSDEVLEQWDAIKCGLEGRKGEESILDEVSRGLPPLMRANKLQKKAAKKGFDWPDAEEPRLRLLEEIAELDKAIATKICVPREDIYEVALASAASAIEDEAGDILFAAINWIRHLGIDPSVALARSSEKFKNRFVYVEEAAEKRGIEMCAENLYRMDALWTEAKSREYL